MRPDLKKRVITALIGVPTILAFLIFGGRFGAAVVALVLSAMMILEFSAMAYSLGDLREKRNFMLGATWLVSFANFLIPRSEYEFAVVAFMGCFVYFLFTADRHKDSDFSVHFKEMLASFFGLIYLVFLPLYLVALRDFGRGAHWVILLFLIVWAADTGAYFAGLRFGKRKLYEAISPKKTIEGLAGGVVTAIVVTLVYKSVALPSFSWVGAVLIAIFVALASACGDLCESFLKRAFAAKDSGSLLPGHGGFLDRFDGVVFGLPVMAICVRLLA